MTTAPERPARVDVDLGDPTLAADPYPTLAALRAAGPLVWHEDSGRWLATTHAAVTSVLRDRRLGRLWADHEPTVDGPDLASFDALHRHQMMENEPPEHTRLRRAVQQAFGRGHVERLRPRIEALAMHLLDELAGDASAGRPVDVVARYAEPMPVIVIADLLGVPRDAHTSMRDWSQAIVRMYEPSPSASVRCAAARASDEFSAWARDLLGRRRAEPRGPAGADLVGDLLESGLSDDELVASIVLLLNAGHEASVNAFGNGLHDLLSHPDQLARVASGDVAIEDAWEELLRHDTPLQLFERTAIADVVIAGQPVRAGERVACLMGSANRDPAAFGDPDRLDVGRDARAHVGFGLGLHFCLGAPLARMELAIALRALLDRHPDLTLARAERRPTWVLRGFRSLEVHLS